MTTANESTGRPAGGTSKGLNIALWVVQALGAAMFLMASFGKLTGNPMMVATFAKIGLGQWFRYVTGGVELLGAVLLLVPALSGVGGLLLACTMVGAVLAHLAVLGGSPLMPLVLLALMAFVAWGRRERTLELLGRA